MKIKNKLSPLGLSAIDLDTHFSEISNLSLQIEQISLDTDSDFYLSLKLINRFTEKAMAIEGIVRAFSAELENARERSSVGISKVAQKAALIQKREEQKDQIQERLNDLGNRVREVIALLSVGSDSKNPSSEKLISVDTEVTAFINEACEIKTRAQEIKFKEAARSAESLEATLKNVRSKLEMVIKAS